jgi:hypothetical protein
MKNLNTKGSKISSYEINIKNNQYVELTIDTEDESRYKYRINKDDRHPDINVTKRKLGEELQESIDNLNKLEIKKYKERNYLFVNGKEDNQYSGIQLQ